MAGWKRIIRGMVGTGVVFGAGSTAVALAFGVAAMIFGNATLNDLRFAGRIGVAGFVLGVGFSGILAVASRSRRFAQLSIPKFAGMGALAGLAYFLLISINGIGSWTLQLAITNFLLLTLMGSGAAAATLFIARKASGGMNSPGELDTGSEVGALGEGAAHVNTNASAYDRESVSARKR